MNTKKIISGIIAVAITGTMFGGSILNVSAADGDHNARYELWANKSGNTPYYYQLDMVRAMYKDDLKTALEGFDYWIAYFTKAGAEKELLEKLNFYRSEMAEKRISKGLEQLLSSNASYKYAPVIERAESGEGIFTYTKYDKYFKSSDDTLGKEDSQTTTPVTPKPTPKPVEDNTSNTPDGGTSVDDKDDVVVTPTNPVEEEVVKVKPTNKYVQFLSFNQKAAFTKVEDRLENIMLTTIKDRFEKFTDEQVDKAISGIDRAVRMKMVTERSMFKKAILEEIKIQIHYYFD